MVRVTGTAAGGAAMMVVDVFRVRLPLKNSLKKNVIW